MKNKLTNLIVVLLLVTLPIIVQRQYAEADTSYTWDGVAGDWLNDSNWSPDGFNNSASDTASASSGSLQCGLTATFQPTLTLNTGAEILGGVNNGLVWTLRDLQLNGGTIRCRGGNSYFNGTINACTGTTSYLDAGTGTYSSAATAWTLTGSGTIEKINTSEWGVPATSSSFTGIFLISNGRALGTSGTVTFGGSGGKIRIGSGGTFYRGSSSSTWTITGGLYLDGGTLNDGGNNGTTYTATTNVTIESSSYIVVDGPASGNRPFIVIRGPLSGSGNLSINTSSNNRGVSFRDSAGTYSGTLTLKANSYLYLGCNPFNSSVSLNLVNTSLLTIGAYRTTDTITDVANVNITVSSLVINGSTISAGTYNQTNNASLGAMVIFNNATSNLIVQAVAGSVYLTTSSGSGGNCTTPAEGTWAYNVSEVVNISATADACYRFVNWTGNTTDIGDVNASSTNISMGSSNKTATANFAINTSTITYTAGANGTLNNSTPQTINCGTNTTYVLATPNACYKFVNWNDSSTMNPRTDLGTSTNYSYLANFAINTSTITYIAGANGTLNNSTPQTINCGTYTTYVLASPNASCAFVNWSDSSTTNPRRDLGTSTNQSFTANFRTLVLSISNTPDSKSFGFMLESTSYWSNGSAPIFALNDSQCFFAVTNNGDIASITINATNFTGGVGWALNLTVDVNKVVMKAGKSGDANEGAMITLNSSPQAFITSLAASATKKWEIKLATGTFTDGVPKSSTITLVATLD